MQRNHPHPSNPFHTASYPTSSSPTIFQSQNYAKFATYHLLQPAESASTRDTHAQLRVSGQWSMRLRGRSCILRRYRWSWLYRLSRRYRLLRGRPFFSVTSLEFDWLCKGGGRTYPEWDEKSRYRGRSSVQAIRHPLRKQITDQTVTQGPLSWAKTKLESVRYCARRCL